MNPQSLRTYVGKVIGQRYRITGVLGQGGMGVVFAAEHLFTNRKVALKLLHPAREDLPELRARFVAEARTAATARHPHIVDVLDMGLTEDGSPFLIMEMLEGTSLDNLIAQRGKLSPKDALALVLPIMGALAVLHDAGIVHRDIKPSNIFLATDSRGGVWPKLLDFGLARVVSDLRLTRSGIVLGTPMYMAPEHAAGEGATLQSDVWSVGVVLYECVAGEPPFASRDHQAIAAQVLAGHTRPLRKFYPQIPAAVAEAIERALRGNRDLRYKNMRDMARSLVAGAVSSGTPLPEDPDPIGLPDYREWVVHPSPLATTVELDVPRGHGEAAGTQTPAATMARQEMTDAVRRPSRMPTTLALLLMIVSLGAGLSWWLGRSVAVAPRPTAVDSGTRPVVPAVNATLAPKSGDEPAPRQRPLPVPGVSLSEAGPALMPADTPEPTRSKPPAAKGRQRNGPPNSHEAPPRSQGGVEIESEWK